MGKAKNVISWNLHKVWNFSDSWKTREKKVCRKNSPKFSTKFIFSLIFFLWKGVTNILILETQPWLITTDTILESRIK